MGRRHGRAAGRASGKASAYLLPVILAAGILIGAGLALFSQTFSQFLPPAVPEPGAPPHAGALNITGPREASVGIVAVSAETGEGLVGTAIVEIIPGRGRILFSTNPFVEPDTQDSIKSAKAAAEKATGISTASYDIIASFDLPAAGADVVGGPSAGVSLALAIMSAVEGKPVSHGVVATGTVDENGAVGPVGGVIEKAEAAGLAGNRLFLIPEGQGTITYYEKKVETQRRNGFNVQKVSYVPRTLDISEYTRQWNMTTFEVSDVWQAAAAAIPGVELTGRSRVRVAGYEGCRAYSSVRT
jgi:uncharacterized protein